MKTALVLGGSGFIGHHLCRRLKQEGYWVRSVDLQSWPVPDTQRPNEELIYDLRDLGNVQAVMRLDYSHEVQEIPFRFSYLKHPFSIQKPFDEVYQLAADMGGAGYIFTGDHDADVMHNSATINLNVASTAIKYGVKKIFYSSSACMYPQGIQGITDACGLKEPDAYPANPDSEYGWEKLFSERLYLAYSRNHSLNVRIARFHNIYGPEGTYKGGREKAPAAICRKVAEADNEIEIWGDGQQTRSFLYIDDCVDAVRRLMESDFQGPVNIGSEEMVSINELAEMVMFIAGKTLTIKHVDGPQGVRGRNSDNTLIEEKLLWKPKVSLLEGIGKTYTWINQQIHE